MKLINSNNGLIFFIFIALLVFGNFSFVLSQETDCPFGKINDTYPGDCRLYTDENQDGICDLSQDIQQNENTLNNSNIFQEKYPFLSIFFLLVLLYILTTILSKKEKISHVLHKKIWNILLTLSFLVCAISSVIYILNLNYGIFQLNQNISFVHIESGIIMIIISIFHIIWHIFYYKNIFKH